MVPSWTETLLEAGIDVVGRTRFCIHPAEKARSIPRVGGTKDWNLAKVQSLAADFILLDREENPKSMAEQAPSPLLVTHVENVRDLPRELSGLGQRLSNSKLLRLSEEWEKVISRPLALDWSSLTDFPGLVEWGVKPSVAIQKIVYVIWRDPWMAVAKNTFIGSVLELCGASGMLHEFSKAAVNGTSEKYPKIDLENLSQPSTLILFSSEPYPFVRKKSELPQFDGPYAFVDGESFSWFGVRSLRFLQRVCRIC
jgi:hypothetical protein